MVVCLAEAVVTLYAVGFTLKRRHNGLDSVSNPQPHNCLLNSLFRRRSKKISELRVTGLYAGNSPGTGVFPAQMASNAENVSIWWRHHDTYPGKAGFCFLYYCLMMCANNRFPPAPNTPMLASKLDIILFPNVVIYQRFQSISLILFSNWPGRIRDMNFQS